MMNVRFTSGAEFAAALAAPLVASEDDSPHLAPTPFGLVGPGRAHSRLLRVGPEYALQNTLIRYRTDGKYPLRPVDEFKASALNYAPGTAASLVHCGRLNDNTHSYSAFARGASGNLSKVVHARATPR